MVILVTFFDCLVKELALLEIQEIKQVITQNIRLASLICSICTLLCLANQDNKRASPTYLSKIINTCNYLKSKPSAQT